MNPLTRKASSLKRDIILTEMKETLETFNMVNLPVLAINALLMSYDTFDVNLIEDDLNSGMDKLVISMKYFIPLKVINDIECKDYVTEYKILKSYHYARGSLLKILKKHKECTHYAVYKIIDSATKYLNIQTDTPTLTYDEVIDIINYSDNITSSVAITDSNYISTKIVSRILAPVVISIRHDSDVRFQYKRFFNKDIRCKRVLRRMFYHKHDINSLYNKLSTLIKISETLLHKLPRNKRCKVNSIYMEESNDNMLYSIYVPSDVYEKRLVIAKRLGYIV